MAMFGASCFSQRSRGSTVFAPNPGFIVQVMVDVFGLLMMDNRIGYSVGTLPCPLSIDLTQIRLT